MVVRALQLKVVHKEIISSSCISSLVVTPDDAYAYLGCWDQQIVTFSVPTVSAPHVNFAYDGGV
jgi:hypothetical protein